MSEQHHNEELMAQAQDMVRRLQALLKNSEHVMHDRIMDPLRDGDPVPSAPAAQDSADGTDGDGE